MATYVLLSIDVSTYITYACVLPVLMMMTMPVSELINSLEVQGLIGVTGAIKHWKYRRRRRPTTNFRLFSLSLYLSLTFCHLFLSLSNIHSFSLIQYTQSLSLSNTLSDRHNLSLFFSLSLNRLILLFALFQSNHFLSLKLALRLVCHKKQLILLFSSFLLSCQ